MTEPDQGPTWPAGSLIVTADFVDRQRTRIHLEL